MVKDRTADVEEELSCHASRHSISSTPGCILCLLQISSTTSQSEISRFAQIKYSDDNSDPYKPVLHLALLHSEDISEDMKSRAREQGIHHFFSLPVDEENIA